MIAHRGPYSLLAEEYLGKQVDGYLERIQSGMAIPNTDKKAGNLSSQISCFL